MSFAVLTAVGNDISRGTIYALVTACQINILKTSCKIKQGEIIRDKITLNSTSWGFRLHLDENMKPGKYKIKIYNSSLAFLRGSSPHYINREGQRSGSRVQRLKPNNILANVLIKNHPPNLDSFRGISLSLSLLRSAISTDGFYVLPPALRAIMEVQGFRTAPHLQELSVKSLNYDSRNFLC